MCSSGFNLIDQPWLPCIDTEGRTVELGIREALLRAPELAELRDPSPLTTAALLRLLLAVLYAAHGWPWTNARRAEVWQAGRWERGVVEAYLDRWKEQFDLFHPRHPFYQDA